MLHRGYVPSLLLPVLAAPGCGGAGYTEQMDYARDYFAREVQKRDSVAWGEGHDVETASTTVSYRPPAPMELVLPAPEPSEGEQPPAVDWTIGRLDLRRFGPTGLRAVFQAREDAAEGQAEAGSEGEGEPALLFLAVYDPRDEEVEANRSNGQEGAEGNGGQPRRTQPQVDPRESLAERTERELSEAFGRQVTLDLRPPERFPDQTTRELLERLGVFPPTLDGQQPIECQEFRVEFPAGSLDSEPQLEVIGYMYPSGDITGETRAVQVLLVFFLPGDWYARLAVGSGAAGVSPIEFSMETLRTVTGAGGGQLGAPAGGSTL